MVEMFTVCAIAARPAGVDRGSGNVDAGGMPEHGRQAGNLRRGLPLGPQCDDEPGERAGSLRPS